MMAALSKSAEKYIVINPNNDPGASIIESVYTRYTDNSNFKFFPSLRFEYFLSLLRNARFMIGNSSAGVREAPYWGIPSINLGSRQKGRSRAPSIVQAGFGHGSILDAIELARAMNPTPSQEFGDGNSARLFLDVLRSGMVWDISPQKVFFDQSYAQ
jgi:UDP-N-acetylglucosamine 2-epimerase (hydrolysing)